MGAFKNEKNGTWYVQFRYTDWQGLRQQKLKRGFATKREVQEWERAFLTEKKAAGVKRIRIHDLRHSHVSLLIELGFSAVAIADRMGHESVDMTYHYAHMFPSRQDEMANKLENERGEFENVG